jgi:hypothetical protein
MARCIIATAIGTVIVEESAHIILHSLPLPLRFHQCVNRVRVCL